MNISKTTFLTSLLLIIIIIAMPLLLSVVFLFKQFVIQVQMKYELESACTQKFTLQIDKLHWIKKDRELLLEGRFFDLKSYTIIKDSIEVTGIFDKAEDELIEKYSNGINHRKEEIFINNSLAFILIFNTTLHQFHPGLQPVLLENFHKKDMGPDEIIIKQYFPVITPPPIA